MINYQSHRREDHIMLAFKLKHGAGLCIVVMDLSDLSIAGEHVDTMPTALMPTALMKNATFVDLTENDIQRDTLSNKHFTEMARLYRDVLDIPADSEIHGAYSAYAMSVAMQDSNFLYLGKISRNDGSLEDYEIVKIATIKDAQDEKSRFNDDYDVGGSTDGGAIVFKDGQIIASLSYNGRLYDLPGFGGTPNKPI